MKKAKRSWTSTTSNAKLVDRFYLARRRSWNSSDTLLFMFRTHPGVQRACGAEVATISIDEWRS
eukprot:14663338-Heterocapsa_arctica.AAC.1